MIDLLLNEFVPSRAKSRPSSYLIAQYWRASDKERYIRVKKGRLEQEKTLQDRRNGGNL